MRYAYSFVFIFIVLFSSGPLAAQQPRSARIIKEGVGWEGFTVGANLQTLVKTLGLPDRSSTGQWLRWPKVGIHCILNKNQQAAELRFDKRFRGITEDGVKFGMTVKQVIALYGEPEVMAWRSGALKLTWPTRGMLIWFHSNTVFQIVVFEAQPPKPTQSH